MVFFINFSQKFSNNDFDKFLWVRVLFEKIIHINKYFSVSLEAIIPKVDTVNIKILSNGYKGAHFIASSHFIRFSWGTAEIYSAACSSFQNCQEVAN